MKRFLCILLTCLVMLGMLSGCSKDSQTNDVQQKTGSFEPETTAVAGGGLTQAIEDIQDNQAVPAAQEPVAADAVTTPEAVVQQPVAVDAQPVAPDAQIAADDAQQSEAPTLEPIFTPEPTAEPVSNSHASITGYSTIGDEGLKFAYSYPVNWNNLPGRSTICYVQPMGEGVKYPARVSVTMKKMPHRGTEAKVKEQFASFFKYISSQYDEETFEANMSLNTRTRFMGMPAMSTTYLAYDGEQEIKGYAICTYFERYMFVFHFLCAYEDYNDFQPAMAFMRDSVKTNIVLED